MSELSKIVGIINRSDFEKFLSKFNITQDDFDKTGYNWNDLKKIKANYLTLKPELEPTANDIVSRMFKARKVHSIRFRIKDEDHLIEKIIRKKV